MPQRYKNSGNATACQSFFHISGVRRYHQPPDASLLILQSHRPLSQRIFLNTTIAAGTGVASAALPFRFFISAGAGISETIVHHTHILERESVLDGGHQFFGGGEDYLDVLYHGGGIELVHILHAHTAEAEAQGAQLAQLHAVAQLQLQGDAVAHQVEARLQFRGRSGGVAGHHAADGAGVQAVGHCGRSVPLARVVLLLKILFSYKSKFWHIVIVFIKWCVGLEKGFSEVAPEGPVARFFISEHEAKTACASR